MPDLLVELLSEEIPARMQTKAAEDLRQLVTSALVERGLTYEGAKAFATPRRLALTVHGLPVHSPATREERKGPRVGAPEGAVQGFLKSAGLDDLSQATIQSDPKKGDFYIAVIEKAGRPATEIIAEVMPQVVRAFPWPKSMRWGPASTSTASLRWVRPLKSVVCLFGPETEEPEVVPFEIDGLVAGATTVGHRLHGPDAFQVKRFEDYVAGLERRRVVLDAERRRQIILHDAKNLAMAQGLELVEDAALLEEVGGLVEWPVVLMGSFDHAFLEIPPQVIRATIRANQKCFVLRGPEGRLANRFLLVANMEAEDGGAAIVAGNERVVRARLSDAAYFWATDQKPLPGFPADLKPLDQRLKKLRDLDIVFHEKLGTQGSRVDRLMALAHEIAPLVGADPDMAARAAELAKADLVTEVVGEFPETQGLMGGLYAALQDEGQDVADAVASHYKPVGPSDTAPKAPTAIAVALADKLDILMGFWSIDEKPTGSKDPFALRRAALGVIRILLEQGLHLPLKPVLERRLAAPVADDLLGFLADRLKVQLKDQGARHDLVDAVLALGARDDMLLIAKRVEALGAFIGTADGAALMAAAKRAGNILRAEEKKDGVTYDGAVDAAALKEPQEIALAQALATARASSEAALAKGDFAGALTALSQARGPVDAFFEAILVNAEDADVRRNRLNLLGALRSATRQVADLARVEG